MAWAASTIHFARRDAREPDMRPLGAPDRPVPIPNGSGCAFKGISRGNYRSSEEQKNEHSRCPVVTRNIIAPVIDLSIRFKQN